MIINNRIIYVARVFVCLALLLLTAYPLMAVGFGELPSEQQHVLKKMSKSWVGQLSEKQQGQLRQGAKQWIRTAPAERKLASQRLLQWQTLSVEEKQQFRQKFVRF